MEDVRAAAYAGSTEGDGAIGVDAGGVCVRARRRSRHHWHSAQALEAFFLCVWESLDREGERTAERGRRGLGNRAWPFRWGLGAAGRETGDLQLALQLPAGARRVRNWKFLLASLHMRIW